MKNELGFAGRLAKAFVENERIGFLMILILFFAGAIFFLLTPKQYNPEITAPAFNVITEFPGASSYEVEEFLTRPIEDAMQDINGVDEVYSQSHDGGLSVVTVKFFVGESIEESKIKIVQKIFGNLDLKPLGSLDPIVKELNPDDIPILVVALSSTELNLTSLRSLAFDLKDHLKHVSGSTNLEVVGGTSTEYRISVSPLLLMERGVTVADIMGVVQSANQRVVIDTLDSGVKGEVLVLDGAFEDPSELANLPIAYRNGVLVLLKDVASIVEVEKDTDSFVRYKESIDDEKNTVFLTVAKQKGVNSATVTDEIVAQLDDFLADQNPLLFEADVVRNEGDRASEEIYGLTINLISSIFIVFIVLFVFLGVRASAVVSISIPLTLFSVFVVGYLFGQSINRITLFALILSLGLLVDNATVVVENIMSHVHKRKDEEVLTKLVVRAVDEVGMGLIMSTVTTLLAFFPMAFVTGMMGPYMGPIPFFVPAALLVSLILAFTINPYLSVKILMMKQRNWDPLKYMAPFFNRFKILEKCKKFYLRIYAVILGIPHRYELILRRIFDSIDLQRKLIGFSSMCLILALILPLFGIVQFRMLPKADRDQFYVYLDLPEAYQLEKTNELAGEVEQYFLNDEMVVSVQSFIGEPPILDFNGLFKGADSRMEENQATLIVNLVKSDDRSITSEEYVLEARQELLGLLGSYPDVELQFVEDPPGPPVMSTFLLKVQGEDPEKLKKIAQELKLEFRSIPELVDLSVSNGTTAFELNFKVNYDKLAYYDLNYGDLLNTLYSGYASVVVGTVHEHSKEQHLIRLQFDESLQESEQDLSSIFVRNGSGSMIPLSELLTVSYETGEQLLYHDNRLNTVYLMGEMGDRSITYATLDAFKKILDYNLPSGQGEIESISPFGVTLYDKESGETYGLRFGGEWELTLEVFRDLGLAMVVAIFLIYLVLVGQFQSFRIPFIVMLTIPFSLIGILPGFAVLGYINGLYFNATSMIGVIALAGIVVNNAIILVESIQQELEKKRPLKEALIHAGASRLRPILLTSTTTVLGSMTILSDPVWAGLAWAIIFGLSTSTFLTLILFPTLYYLSEGGSFYTLLNKRHKS